MLKDGQFMRFSLLLTLSAMVVATPAMAQTAPVNSEDALAQCLVLKSTGADRQALVRWILGSLASSSLATDMVKVDPAAKEASDRANAAVFTRLMSVDCLTEIRVLAKAGDNAGLKAAFGALGKIAMQDAMQDRSVSVAMGAFTRFMPEDVTRKIQQ
jgi:hypothetical protein